MKLSKFSEEKLQEIKDSIKESLSFARSNNIDEDISLESSWVLIEELLKIFDKNIKNYLHIPLHIGKLEN